MDAVEGARGLSHPADRMRAVISAGIQRSGAGDAERGGEGKKVQSQESSKLGAEGPFSAPGFVALFFCRHPSPDQQIFSFLQPLCQEQAPLGSPRLPYTILGTGFTWVEDFAQQLVSGWSQTQEGAQDGPGGLSITSGSAAPIPEAAGVPEPRAEGCLQGSIWGGVSSKPVIGRLMSQVQCVIGAVWLAPCEPACPRGGKLLLLPLEQSQLHSITI